MEATGAAPTSDFRHDAQHRDSEDFDEQPLAREDYSSAREHKGFHSRLGCSSQLTGRISTTAHVEVFSNISPSGWRALCDQSRKTYSADLPFVHHPTFLELLAAEQTSTPIRDVDGSTDDLTGMPLDSVILLLSFLALTLRHCEIGFDWRKSHKARAHFNLEQSKTCARLSLLCLGHNSSTKRNTIIESVQARLMLACYQWSFR